MSPEKSGNQLRTFLAMKWDGHDNNIGFLEPVAHVDQIKGVKDHAENLFSAPRVVSTAV